MNNDKTRFKCFDHLDGALCKNLPWYKKYHDSKFVNVVHSLVFVLFLFGILGGISYTSFMTEAPTVRAANKYWDGGGTDGICGGNVGDGNKFSCPANWNGNTPPANGDVVLFGSISTKDAVLDTDFNVTLLDFFIIDGYTGTITLENNFAMTGAFSQTGNNTFNAQDNTMEVGGSFDLAGGTFNAPSGNLILRGGSTFGALATFNHNNGTVVFDSNIAGNAICNSTVFHLVDLSIDSNFNTSFSNCNLPLGNNPTIARRFPLYNSQLSGTGTINLTSSGYISIYGGSSLSGFNGLSGGGSLTISDFGGNHDFSGYSPFTVRDLRIEGGTVILPNDTQISRRLELSPANVGLATLVAPSGNLYLLGSFLHHEEDVFNHNNGTVILSGTNQTISGNVAFNNLHKLNSGQITFAAGTTQTILGELKLAGVEENPLVLKSTSEDSEWSIDPQGTADIKYIDVKDSNNINPQELEAFNSIDSGNNTNWIFSMLPEEPEEPEEPTDPDNSDDEDNSDEDEEENEDDKDDSTDDKDDSTKDDTNKDTDTAKDKDTDKVTTKDPETQKPTLETPTPETSQPPTTKDDQTIIEEKVASAQSINDPIFYFILFVLLLALITWAIVREHKQSSGR